MPLALGLPRGTGLWAGVLLSWESAQTARDSEGVHSRGARRTELPVEARPCSARGKSGISVACLRCLTDSASRMTETHKAGNSWAVRLTRSAPCSSVRSGSWAVNLGWPASWLGQSCRCLQTQCLARGVQVTAAATQSRESEDGVRASAWHSVSPSNICHRFPAISVTSFLV